jgi:hypothetical protein
MKLYNIAGHFVAIDFKDERFDETLLPNFSPFVSNDDSFPLLTISVYAHCEWKDEISEVGTFDVGGCMYGVWRTIEGGYRYEINDIDGHLCARMQSDALFNHCEVELLEGTPSQMHYGLNNCVMMSYAFATATQDTILIHSSVIRCDGKGYLMTAPSGTGKSTHTHLWYTTIPGCDLMNDDNPIIRVLPGGDAIVYGSPWSGKTPCYRNIQAPIGGIVNLKQRPENSIRKLKAVEAFTILLPACSSMKWDSRVYRGVCDSITKFIQKCNVWELGCLPNSEAAILCHDTISKENNS